MSETRPALVLQMQRMGDLILTFPLLLWLNRLRPEQPVWVVAEPRFYEPLMVLSPPAVYVPWEGVGQLRGKRFSLALNLSHRPEAAALLRDVQADAKLGPLAGPAGGAYIHGAWQLYRASLTHNNRHNRFHWADMNGLDAVPLERMAATRWSPPQALDADARRVGLFLGASQPEKRPSALFWARLVRALLRLDLRPVLLGGPAEETLGERVATEARVSCLNLCGKLSLAELTAVGKTLSLMVTPDTGPMHLAAWTGLRTLNLSMGPVHPWETGPYQPGHYVLQAAMSCVGCWACRHAVPHVCRERFRPGRVAELVHELAAPAPDPQALPALPGLRLMQTGRDGNGLYHLQHISGPAPASCREHVTGFWQSFFLHALAGAAPHQVYDRWRALAAAHPAAARALKHSAASLGGALAQALKRRHPLDADFWNAQPPITRPLAGFLHMTLQNADYAPAGFVRALELVDSFAQVASQD